MQILLPPFRRVSRLRQIVKTVANVCPAFVIVSRFSSALLTRNALELIPLILLITRRCINTLKMTFYGNIEAKYIFVPKVPGVPTSFRQEFSKKSQNSEMAKKVVKVCLHSS